MKKRLHLDKSALGQHGIFFNASASQVRKDFDYINNLSLTSLANYRRQIIVADNQVIKIWMPENYAGSILRIIEINSTYLIDTTENKQRFKDRILYTNYFIQMKDTARCLRYQTIVQQGISNYSIGSRQVEVNREMRLVGLSYIDNRQIIQALINKYHDAQ